MGGLSYFEYMEQAGEMPDIKDYPQIERPQNSLPDVEEELSDIPAHALGQYIQVFSGYNASAEVAVGIYAAAEEAHKQNLAKTRRQVFMEKYEEGEFTGKLKEHQNYIVDEDPRVMESEEKYHLMKQGHIMFKQFAEGYEKMMLLYMSERKHRREYAINSKMEEDV